MDVPTSFDARKKPGPRIERSCRSEVAGAKRLERSGWSEAASLFPRVPTVAAFRLFSPLEVAAVLPGSLRDGQLHAPESCVIWRCVQKGALRYSPSEPGRFSKLGHRSHQCREQEVGAVSRCPLCVIRCPLRAETGRVPPRHSARFCVASPKDFAGPAAHGCHGWAPSHQMVTTLGQSGQVI